MTMKSSFPRLEKLSVFNYKGVDSLDISFPDGLVATDPDFNILGSMNGVGKTSVLECCAWVLLAYSGGADRINEIECDFASLVRSGADAARVTGYFSCGKKTLHRVSVRFGIRGRVSVAGACREEGDGGDEPIDVTVDRILGRVSEPAYANRFFFLHSYRKVREGRPELGMLLDGDPSESLMRRRRIFYHSHEPVQFSLFKRLIVKHLMQNAKLFDVSSLKREQQDDASIGVLNGLLSQYAEVRVGKLKPFANNTIDVMVEKLSGPANAFSIDGLSSGQKEIISTLFLIWHATYKHPRTVLIDEPELHLNEQWHAGFVGKLIELAPWNQYIVATHAKAIMESVRERNRHLLVGEARDGDRPL